jgi:hypothetical protein
MDKVGQLSNECLMFHRVVEQIRTMPNNSLADSISASDAI